MIEDKAKVYTQSSHSTALGRIRTHDTLHSRQVLYHQGSSAEQTGELKLSVEEILDHNDTKLHTAWYVMYIHVPNRLLAGCFLFPSSLSREQPLSCGWG